MRELARLVCYLPCWINFEGYLYVACNRCSFQLDLSLEILHVDLPLYYIPAPQHSAESIAEEKRLGKRMPRDNHPKGGISKEL